MDGFNTRRNNGKKAAVDLLTKLGTISSTTEIDFVAHSMGFAYAQGMLEVLKGEVLKGKLTLGRFYILAPENGCSGTVIPGDFKDIWQYGTDENKSNTPVYKQDGVAPQCLVVGLPNTKRAFIPTDWYPQGFLDSHKITNYEWIFNILKPGDQGYVVPRN